MGTKSRKGKTEERKSGCYKCIACTMTSMFYIDLSYLERFLPAKLHIVTMLPMAMDTTCATTTLHMTHILGGPHVWRQFNVHKVTRTLTLQSAKNPREIMSTSFGVLQACFAVFVWPCWVLEPKDTMADHWQHVSSCTTWSLRTREANRRDLTSTTMLHMWSRNINQTGSGDSSLHIAESRIWKLITNSKMIFLIICGKFIVLECSVFIMLYVDY